MPTTEGEGPGGRFEVRADASTHFAWLRTRMALERTLMAWARTAVSLVGFGFTIFQFFERLNAMDNVAPTARPQLPRYFALALIGAGTIALIISILEYRWAIRYLWSPDFAVVAGVAGRHWITPIVGISIVLTLIGLAAFIAVFLRVT